MLLVFYNHTIMGRKQLTLYLSILITATACNVHKSATEQRAEYSSLDSTTTESHLSILEKLSHDSLSLEIIDISSAIYDSAQYVRIRTARLINNHNEQSHFADTFNTTTITGNTSENYTSTTKESFHKSNSNSLFSLVLIIAIIIATILLILRKFKL